MAAHAQHIQQNVQFITRLEDIARISHKSTERLQIKNKYTDETRFLYKAKSRLYE